MRQLKLHYEKKKNHLKLLSNLAKIHSIKLMILVNYHLSESGLMNYTALDL